MEILSPNNQTWDEEKYGETILCIIMYEYIDNMYV
jgi:hypothetical protein